MQLKFLWLDPESVPIVRVLAKPCATALIHQAWALRCTPELIAIGITPLDRDPCETSMEGSPEQRTTPANLLCRALIRPEYNAPGGDSGRSWSRHTTPQLTELGSGQAYQYPFIEWLSDS